MKHPTKVRHHRNPLTGLDYDAHCKTCHATIAYCRTRKECDRIKDAHNLFHREMWAA